MTKISNLTQYLMDMDKSLFDKLFFIGKVKANTYIDYGCGNGSITEFMLNNFKNYNYLCYDFNQDIVNLLKNKFINFNNEIINVTDTKEDLIYFFKQNLKYRSGNTCLILSSVLHEIYNYDNPSDFWSLIRELKPKYIAIRDMIPSLSIDKVSDPEDVRKVQYRFSKAYIESFESFNGKIANNKNLIHFLLKSEYKDNWPREVRENYFILNKETLYETLPYIYEIIYEEHYVLPYFKERCKMLGVDIKDNTHLKMILKLKEN
jgi:SAM-dependent methyltransferase